MNWMLLTALALAFGLIVGNLMLLRYLDKLSGARKRLPETLNAKKNSQNKDNHDIVSSKSSIDTDTSDKS